MRLACSFALAAVAGLVLSACDSRGTAPAVRGPIGQVVATVNGQEITLLELRAELTGGIPSDPEALRTAEQGALRTIIARKILADAAREQGLDNTPEFALQRLRTTDSLLVQALQAKIAREMPAPGQDEAERFVADHRDIFAERKIFIVDQITMPRPDDVEKLREFEPLKTMAEVEARLARDGIKYRRSANAVIDAVGADPNLIDRIVKLPPREVFVMPGGDGIVFNQVRETQVMPFTGEPATTYALELIRQQRIQETTQREFNAIAAKAASSIQYNEAYLPAPPEGSAPSSASEPAGTEIPPEKGPDAGSASGGKAG